MHVPLLAQMGLAAGQVALVRHPTQVPLVEQKVRVGSLRAVHCAAAVQAAQAPFVQMGALVGHVVLFKHWTHLLVLVSQSGVAPEQVVVSMHWTQAPVVAHAGWVVSRAAHWADPAQATHVPALEQIGVPAGQVALDRHCGAGRSGLLASKVLSTAEPLSTNKALSTAEPLSTTKRLSSTKALSII